MDRVDCLEMSLESGLGTLKDLKELRELNMYGMRTRIGVPEVQWMVEHWPKLQRVYDLRGGEGNDEGAEQWLRENCPWIEAQGFRSYDDDQYQVY